MEDNKLLALLKTFKPNELARLDDFVQSPYHNKNRHVLALWQYLEQRLKDAELVMDKAGAFAAMMPHKPFDDLKLRHVTSMLLKLVEDFMTVEKSTDNERRLKLLSAYRERKLPKHFEGIKRQGAKGALSITDYYAAYQAAMEEEQMSEQTQERRKTTHLQRVSDSLDVFYLTSKLKQGCAMLSYQNVFKQQYRFDLLEEVLAHLQQHSYTEPLLNLYHHGLLILRNPADEASFVELKRLLQVHQADIPLKEAQDLHVIARNYCIRKLNTGEVAYVAELLDLFRFELAHGILLNELGQLSPSTFKNIVAVASRQREYDWAEQFVTDYAAHLEPRYHNDYLNYNLARISFDRRDYARCIQLLSQVEYHDVFVAADARTLLVKTYFELDEHDALSALLDSFRQFVTRRKELAYHKENYLNIIKFTKRILSLGPYEKPRKNALEHALQNTKVLTEKVWLLDKLRQL